ncbi:uncharacterized protein LOC144066699 isoform X2 [Stigmatopora argus]
MMGPSTDQLHNKVLIKWDVTQREEGQGEGEEEAHVMPRNNRNYAADGEYCRHHESAVFLRFMLRRLAVAVVLSFARHLPFHPHSVLRYPRDGHRTAGNRLLDGGLTAATILTSPPPGACPRFDTTWREVTD